MSYLGTVAAAVSFFFVADLVYTLDHYLVHHDRERYRTGHFVHHRRYSVVKNAPQLDEYELSTYGSAGLLSTVGMATLSLLTGNWGFAIGAALKFVHSLLFHLYQHYWWGQVPVRKQGLPIPKRGWGLSTAHYHAHHHAHPEHEVFTFSESWQGFDRILEWAHPWLVKYTVDYQARAARMAAREAEKAAA